MLRRSILAVSRRRASIGRVPRQSATQISFLCTRRGFSSTSQQNAAPGPGSTSKSSGSTKVKFFLGGVAIGAGYTAYKQGYLDDILGKKQQNSADLLEVHGVNNKQDVPKGDINSPSYENNGETMPRQDSENSAAFDVEDAKESSENQSVADSIQDSGNSSEMKPKEEQAPAMDEQLPKFSDEIPTEAEESTMTSTTRDSAVDENFDAQKLVDSATNKSESQEASSELQQGDEKLPMSSEADAFIQGNKMNEDPSVEPKFQDVKDTQSQGQETATSLLDTYNLSENVDERASTSKPRDIKHSSSSKDDSSIGASGDLSDVYVNDGKLILDFLQAIHAAEQRQAELDARVFAEEKRAIKEKYEKELKDARARELMYAEEAAMLEKELEKERAKAVAARKSLQEEAEQRLKMELEEKERETESKLKKFQELAKAELAASLAREKAAQVEKMAEANLNINALCMAFYARSEEARQTHSFHKLALGALALEDALSNGLPVQAELDALNSYIESVDKDSLLQLALSSLPEDVRLHGVDSPLQLNEKFDKLKGSLRHFSLIPPEGGGILAHSLAYVASFLKVKEADQSGDGIESVINKVDHLLALGKLAEAADVLENGVKGSKATELVADWVRKARNRAIAEQALILLQSYAASVSLT